MGGKLLGWRTRCAVELDAYCRRVLLRRQKEGALDPFPIWDDIRTFDGMPWRSAVDVISGGFPCQDISSAGKGKGLAGDRSGLWFEMLRVIGEVRPAFVFAENSPHLRTRGLGTIIEGLAGLGYDCRWCVLGAWHVSAPHKRNRLWLLAHPNNRRERIQPIDAEMACAPEASKLQYIHPDWWSSHPFQGVANGNAHRMDRVRATGNAQVPAVAATAFRLLSERA